MGQALEQRFNSYENVRKWLNDWFYFGVATTNRSTDGINSELAMANTLKIFLYYLHIETIKKKN